MEYMTELGRGKRFTKTTTESGFEDRGSMMMMIAQRKNIKKERKGDIH